jgi:hypothetical protein
VELIVKEGAFKPMCGTTGLLFYAWVLESMSYMYWDSLFDSCLTCSRIKNETRVPHFSEWGGSILSFFFFKKKNVIRCPHHQ